MNIANRVKEIVYRIGEKNALGNLMYTRIKYVAAKILGAIMTDEQYANWFHKAYTGEGIDLKEPKTFDEKLWWLKLHNRDPLMTRCSDKYLVREYVKECGFEDILIPQYEVLDTVDQIDLSKYSEEIVIKCNHNSGGHLFYNPQAPVSKKEIKNKIRLLKYILKQNAYVLSHEWNYKNISPKLVVEKVIRDKNNHLPVDYKFHCFGGEPKLMFLDVGVMNSDGTYNHNYPRNVYNMDFELQPITEYRNNTKEYVPKPDNWDYMVQIAKKLSEPFPYVRVDLYNIDGKIYFGELTFYYGGGVSIIEPVEWRYTLGSWIDLKSDKIVLGGSN